MIRDGTLGVDTAGDLITVGAVTSSVGLLAISSDGRLGNGVLDPDLFVGLAGNGTFNVDDNGRADIGAFNLGQSEGSTGAATISGPHAVVDASKSIALGFSGTGTLTIQNGGTLTNADYVRFGNLIGSSGTATVTGIGSSWTQASIFTVGDSGDGTLNVQTGGVVNTAGAVSIGKQASGIGTVIVTGADATWNAGSTLELGGAGVGNLALTSGGRATVTGATTLGAATGSQGYAVISGAGSRWSTAAVTVGTGGKGDVLINSGGVVNSSGNVTLAGNASSVAKATVSGSGSAWNVTGALSVATLGTGTLTVDTQGTVSATGALTIGDPAGALGRHSEFQRRHDHRRQLHPHRRRRI